MKIWIGGIVALFGLSGCLSTSGPTYNYCTEHGYNGVVVGNHMNQAKIHCSDGRLSPSGQHFVTSDGDKEIKHHTYYIRD